MCDTIIEHVNDSGCVLRPNNLAKFDSTTTIRDINDYLQRTPANLISYDYTIEIFNKKHNSYFELDDTYIQQYQAFRPYDDQSNIPIKLRITWKTFDDLLAQNTPNVNDQNNRPRVDLEKDLAKTAMLDDLDEDLESCEELLAIRTGIINSTITKIHLPHGQSTTTPSTSQSSISIGPIVNETRITTEPTTQSVGKIHNLLDGTNSPSTDSALQSIPCGLENLGNTCYLNVILQIFAHTPPLMRWILNDKHHETCLNYENCFLCIFQQTLHAMDRISKQDHNRFYPPTLLRSQLEKLSIEFAENTQQDSNELLIKLLDHTAQSSSIFYEIFNFQTRCVVCCGVCHNLSDRIESQTILQCAIPLSNTSSRLIDCLNDYFKKEFLTGDNAYECSSCQKKQKATRETKVHSLPQILPISLKRFGANGHAKLLNNVLYDEVLHLGQWLSEDCRAKTVDKEKVYYLYGLIIHCGNDMESGHYICYIKDESTNKWYEANDKSIKLIENVIDKTDSVYILCYIRSDLSKFDLQGSRTMNNELPTDSSELTRSIPLPNALRENIKFGFEENIHDEQRRCGTCDIYRTSDSEKPQAKCRSWIKGEKSKPGEVTYPKLKVTVLDEFQHGKWSVQVTITTEKNQSGVFYLHPEKKLFDGETNQSETMINTIKIDLKSDELSKQMHELLVCPVNQGNLVKARKLPLTPFYNILKKEFIPLKEAIPGKSANDQRIDLKKFHLVCVLCWNNRPVEYCLSNCASQYDDGAKRASKRSGTQSGAIAQKKSKLSNSKTTEEIEICPGEFPIPSNDSNG
ncbi:unnamed protein product [Adineta ricciae]|uniref:Ubiquitin carboxyl-terminal hydrolase n=1 Tax=Adineta ricciae TaxID=249248 RepID=A0A813XIV2_ADIRI|nr:unnamed protein product [Adineta ricciae]CAF1338727.1 unnamed protein product [Adineta ricciae]